MLPEEKAKRLYDKFFETIHRATNDEVKHDAIECALVAVDEMIDLTRSLHKPEYVAFIPKDKFRFEVDDTEYDTHIHGYEMEEYLQLVKRSIEKLQP